MTTENLYTRQPEQIVMYLTTWCSDCRRARSFLERNNILFIAVDVEKDAQAEAFVKEINSGNRSVPTIIFPDGSVLVEPSTEELNEKFADGARRT